MHVYKYTYSCNSCTSPWKPFFPFSNYIASSNKTFNCTIPKNSSDIQNTYCTKLLQYYTVYCSLSFQLPLTYHLAAMFRHRFSEEGKGLYCLQSVEDSLTKGHMIVSVARFLLWYHVYICRVFFPTLRNKSWQMPLRVLMSQSEHIHILVIWHSRYGPIHLLSTVLKTHAAYYTRTYKDKDDRKPDHEL